MRRQIRRRRRVAAILLSALLASIAYLALTATVFAPIDKHGARLVHLEIQSSAVRRELGVNVIVPRHPGPPDQRSLLVFLHGRSGSEETFNEAVFRGLPLLKGQGPVIVFPSGGVHSYWHNRRGQGWATYVMEEVIPRVVRRFGINPQRIAIGGISMGGFGAYDLALKYPGRFCAVGGHSPALWFDGSETAPGAFDDAADFERNDVVGMVERDPDAFGDARIWNDFGSEDPFQVYDEGFVNALRAGNADLIAHSWPGGHEGDYWNDHWPEYQRFYVNSLRHCD
jgi:S-formylglutathione hydrolase FrmB